MIASYDGKSGRWSATGLALSLLVGGVAFTGAVRGQSAAPPAGTPAPAAEAAAPPATAREVNATPAAASTPAPEEPITDEAGAQKLWDEKYASKIRFEKGVEANRDEVDREYLAELKRRGGPLPLAEPAAAAARPDSALHEDVDAALLAQLDRKLPEMSFDGAPLTDVVDFLRDVSGGANLVVEWRALESAGVDRNAPVSLRVRNIKFSRALDLVLSAVGGGTVPLGYTLDGNVIRVSTGEHLDSITDVRAYDVRDITAREVPMNDLTKLLTESVAPDSWRDAGGSVGVIRPTRNKLVVTQTPMNHRQIRSVLQMLREEPREPARATDAASAAQGPTRQTAPSR